MRKWILGILTAAVSSVLLSATTIICLVIPAMSMYSYDIHSAFDKLIDTEITQVQTQEETVQTSLKTVTVTADEAKLRAGSGVMFTEVETTVSGTELFVIDSYTNSESKWYKVLSGNKSLWVDSRDVSESDIVNTVELKREVRDVSRPCHLWRELTLKVDAAVLYKEPDTSSPPLAMLKRGEKFISYSSKGDGEGTSWFKLNIDGIEGYVSRKMFNVRNVYDPIPNRDFRRKKPVIYLSPSRQNGNPYKTGGTTEKKEMEAVGAILYDKLLDYDCIVYVATPAFTLSQRTNEAYNFDTDIYIAIHSNATGNTSVRYGANAYYFPGCEQSKEYAESVIESLNKVTVFGHEDDQIHDGMAFTDNYGYAEVRDPGTLGMISILVETEYHDNANSAQWIRDHHEELADGLLESIVRTLKLKKHEMSASDISKTDK